jgi:phosphoribosylformylglycinamidine synthase
VIRQYDHEVQGGSVIKPLVGAQCDGPSDAAVIAPKLGSQKGLAIANGINVRYGMIDPYWMAAACVDEAIRQIIVVGGDPERIALLDNFCWGNPDKPDRLGGLVRAALGCYDAAVAYGAPFISGKDSLYNEFAVGKKSMAIPGTILISAIGLVKDITKCVTMDFKRAGNLIYAVGVTKPEMGGSIYYDTLGYLGSQVPKADFPAGRKIFTALSRAIAGGLVDAAHDCSEGGLGAAAEMAFSGELGVSARLDLVPCRGRLSDEERLFSESCSRFIVEVDPKNKSKFERHLKGLPCAVIGRVAESPELIIYGAEQRACVQTYISDLKTAWKKPLNW